MLAKLKGYSTANGYTLSGDIGDAYGNVTLSKMTPIENRMIPLPSRMGRKAVSTKIRINDRVINIINVHLDSMTEDTERRILQLQMIMKAVGNRDVIIAGDFNFGDGEKENGTITAFTDPGKKSGAATFDVHENSLAGSTKFENEQSRRLDKILASSGIGLAGYELHKFQNSDHFPISAKIVP